MTLEIRYNGQPALTIPMATARYGLPTPQAMRKAILYGHINPLPAGVDYRTPLYLQADLDRYMASRRFHPRTPAPRVGPVELVDELPPAQSDPPPVHLGVVRLGDVQPFDEAGPAEDVSVSPHPL